ncbi:HD-GYP domain-containing protein [Pseudocolwellia agarivorans]|uniref:HD-GYP domain-containing protein n=1 Tax=Pseudocolwellia agarivorans TaxID=1911682 RepID=UPI000985DF9E|nr:HD domain-containing phosphohydrolase [Pseudocolwellia agarivorans]
MSEISSSTISIEELKLGMYVLNVKCEKRFFKIKTKGLVKSNDIINQLKKQGVTSIVIREDKSLNPPTENLAVAQKPLPRPASKKTLHKQKSVAEEFHQSCKIYDNATETIKDLFNDINTNKKINITAINQLAEEITNSIIRNEYAISILTRIRDKSTYQWEHAVNSAILMCGFVLFLGLKKEVATQIAIGALLHDVGVAKIPKTILDKKGKLTPNEQKLTRKHLTWGHKICHSQGLSNKITTDMMINHHERLDGSGYPRGLDASKLSRLARITAIVDVYDAMTGSKYYKQGVQPINALRYLMSKNEQFDRVLVQQFIKYMGVHPVGSVVKLSNETLAVIVKGNRKSPLQPSVIAFYNTKHKRNMTSKEYFLENESLSIQASAKAEDYKINISKVIREVIG